ncbi:hypothetical protein [Streptomyces sp. LARHCF252]
MSAKRGISATNMIRTSVRASRLPRHTWGLPLPKVTGFLSAWDVEVVQIVEDRLVAVAHEITEVRVDLTVFDGRVVFER